MNKQQAEQYAWRLVAGYIEELFFTNRMKDRLIYDWHSHKEIEGRALSAADRDRVCDAMQVISEQAYRRGGNNRHLNEIHASLVANKLLPDGKPGPKWRGYEQWLKRQGRA